ncbi:MAG: sulfatase-like hydrolase/transferase [Terriglobales bacterium]
MRKNNIVCFKAAKIAAGLALGVLTCGAAIAQNATAGSAKAKAKLPSAPGKPPNILLIIMDDVGIDQMTSFGYGSVPNPLQNGADNLPPVMPNIDAVASAGVRFRNTWSMPECSPGRAVMFTGRYPLRSNILQAIGPNDLNNSHVATWEVTTPKLLQQANYSSGLFGKFHLGGPENNEFGDGAPASIGWDYFYGWTGGLPGAIDTTAGGVGSESGPEGTYSCGFVPRAVDEGGAGRGACYIPSGRSVSCKALFGANAVGDSVGLQCLAQGGVLVPKAACQMVPPKAVLHGFRELENAHYVSPLVINQGGKVEEVPLEDGRGRGFRASIEVNAAINWINHQAASAKPWMATVSFSADHTPLQPPPGNLLSPATRKLVSEVIATGGGCTTPGDDNRNVQLMSNALIEGMDTEFGRLLVETGMAHLNADGRTVTYNPQDSNTVIVIVGDNGSLGSTVKLPFDPSRAKATAYQTGAWVPLIVAGPVVTNPGRDVNSMVNVADMFELFGEVAGIDVKKSVPRQLDSYPLMPYLTNPDQAELRPSNFTQGGFNIQKDGAHNPPCVVPFPPGTPPPLNQSRGVCSQVPVSKSVCEDNYGVWWGPGADPASTLPGFKGVAECWQVNEALYEYDSEAYERAQVRMLPQIYSAVRNDRFKLVSNMATNYLPPDKGSTTAQNSIEFYEINEDKSTFPVTLKIDRVQDNLLPPCVAEPCDTSGLTETQLTNYNALSQELGTILASSPACPGDGNGDGVVDWKDVGDWYQIATTWRKSSHYDFNFDGRTNLIDYGIILKNWGPCPMPK